NSSQLPFSGLFSRSAVTRAYFCRTSVVVPGTGVFETGPTVSCVDGRWMAVEITMAAMKMLRKSILVMRMRIFLLCSLASDGYSNSAFNCRLKSEGHQRVQ